MSEEIFSDLKPLNTSLSFLCLTGADERVCGQTALSMLKSQPGSFKKAQYNKVA